MKKIIFSILLIFALIGLASAGTITVTEYNRTSDILSITWDYADLINLHTDSGIEVLEYPTNTYRFYQYSENPFTIVWIVDKDNPVVYNAQKVVDPAAYQPGVTIYNFFNFERTILLSLSILFCIIGFWIWLLYLPGLAGLGYFIIYLNTNSIDGRMNAFVGLMFIAALISAAWRIQHAGDD